MLPVTCRASEVSLPEGGLVSTYWVAPACFAFAGMQRSLPDVLSAARDNEAPPRALAAEDANNGPCVEEPPVSLSLQRVLRGSEGFPAPQRACHQCAAAENDFDGCSAAVGTRRSCALLKLLKVLEADPQGRNRGEVGSSADFLRVGKRGWYRMGSQTYSL